MANTVKLKRGSGSDPSASDMVVGEPVIRTDTAELFFKKDDGSVAKVSGGGGGPDFKYLALRNAANNGSASYPGNDFTLVTSGTTTAISPAAANTLLVSYGGVIQKPNSGTSTSGITGFIVDGSRIKTATNFAAAPDFILYQESGGIGEPSDGTVTEAKLSVSNNPTNGYFLSAQSGNTGGLTWAAVDLSGKLDLTGGTLTGDTTLANTKKVIFNHSSGAGAYIKHQSGHFEIISSVGNTYFAAAGTLYLRSGGNTNALTLDSSQNATFAGSITAGYGTFFQSTGQSNVIVGSGNAGGAALILDGDSNGDSSGGDYAFIRHNTSGDLEIAADNPNNDGEIKFYTADANTLALTLAGYNATFAGHIYQGDNDAHFFGADNDITIFADGNNSYIDHSGAGDLYIRTLGSQEVIRLNAAKDIELRVASGNDVAAKFIGDGSVELFFDNVKSFETNDNGATVYGGEGQHANLYLYADEGDDNADKLRIQQSSSGDLWIENYASGSWEAYLLASPNGAISLYYDNAKVFYTESYGAVVKRPSGGATVFEVIGSENQEAIINMFADDGDDNDDKFRLRAGTDNFYIESYADGAWEKNIEFEGGDGVKLYQSDGLKCQTISNGFQIEGGGAIYMPSGSWTGETTGKIQSHGGGIYFQCGSNSGYWDFRLPNGSNVANINSSGTYSSSDERLKKDITTIPNAVDTIKQLTGRSFTWINGDKKSFGIIAQEVQSVLPDIVDTPPDPANKYPDDPMRSVNYAALTGHFIEAIKELSAKIETLETKVAALEGA